MRRFLWLGLIFISGMSGLIYEVVWHRYLAILLGAQARATAVVLAIFLGGISVGYACFGRWSKTKSWNLLRVYAVVELALGAWAMLFPLLFKVAEPLTSHFYAWFGVNSLFIDIFMSVALIGFPTFLMGGTLPLLTQGLAEDLEKASKTHAMIYGINTVGACFGCLMAGYALIPWIGLVGSVQVAAGGNLLVAAVAYFYLASLSKARPVKESKRQKSVPFSAYHKALLFLGFLSGFYLLTLQTLLIRLMGLSTGSSNYNFTLIVSIFILGLGIGSLVVRRIEHYTARRLFYNQMGVVVGLFLLYRSGAYWPYWVHVARSFFRDSMEAFFPYQALLGVGFSALLLIPIGLAGLTLPLCFHLMKDDKDTLGQRVGQLYGFNTLGCVFGALIGGYFLYYFWNIDQLFKLCVYLSAFAVIAAGYLVWSTKKISKGELWSSGFVVAGFLALTFLSPLYSKSSYIQPFRHPQPIPNVTYNGAEAFYNYLGRSTQYLFYKDGPNTSVGIGSSTMDGHELSRTIIINGKSDGNTRGDYFTTSMLAHIPGLLAKDLEKVCVIGFGTGTTIGLLADYDDIKDIEVAEISGTLIEHANLFDPYNGKASQQAKVHFNEMDAFRYLEGTNKSFSFIVSEPSNPWVAGIENLYSKEFYSLAKRKLLPGGLFVQWIHTYSFDDQLFRMVLKTMGTSFSAVSVFQLRGGDYALIGSDEPFDRSDLRRGERRFESSDKLQKALFEAGITTFPTVLALEVVPFSLSKVMGEGSLVHQLESPLLSNAAAKAFFANSSSNVESLRRQFKEYYASVSDSLLTDYTNGRVPNDGQLQAFRQSFCDTAVSKNATLCDETLAALKMRNPKFDPSRVYENPPSNRDLASLEQYTTPPKGKSFGPNELQVVYDMFDVYKKYYSPIAYFPVEYILGRLDYCMKVVSGLDSMYGECLLEKILTFETARLRGVEFKASVSEYLRWFDTLPPSMNNYGKLKEAKDILVKMVELDTNSPG